MGKTIKRILTGMAFVSTLCFGSIAVASGSDYTVNAGDSLWKIAGHYQISVEEIKSLNNLSSDTIYVGQTLKLTGSPVPPAVAANSTGAANPVAGTNTGPVTISVIPKPTASLSQALPGQNQTPAPGQTSNQNQASVSGGNYTIQPGDSPYQIAQKFGISLEELLKCNNLGEKDIIYPGQTIAIPGSGPDRPTTTPAPTLAAITAGTAGTGQLVDWFKEGKSLLKSGLILTILDINSQKSFRVKVLCAGNHADVETLTKQDTATMLQIFGQWQWAPRAVVINVNGRQIAGSLSGQPHDISTVKDNGVDGHFDLYLHNSEPHGTGIAPSYVQQHRDAVLKAAGQL